MGVVSIDKLSGEFRANAILKAITKAKRRVTLSVCGLGFLDETEVETLVPQGAQTFDAEGTVEIDATTVEPPPSPGPVVYPPPREGPPPEPPKPEAKPKGKRTVRDWLEDFKRDCKGAATKDEAQEILEREAVVNCRETFSKWPDVIKEIEDARQTMIDRFWSHDQDELLA